MEPVRLCSLSPKSPNPSKLEQHGGHSHAVPCFRWVSSLSCVHATQRDSPSHHAWSRAAARGFLLHEQLSQPRGGWKRGPGETPDPATLSLLLGGPPAFFQLGGVSRPAPTLEPGPGHTQQHPCALRIQTGQIRDQPPHREEPKALLSVKDASGVRGERRLSHLHLGDLEESLTQFPMDSMKVPVVLMGLW